MDNREEKKTVEATSPELTDEQAKLVIEAIADVEVEEAQQLDK